MSDLDTPLIFERRPGGRILALLGVIPVGEISSTGVSFAWFLMLPALPHITHHDKSLDSAKRAMAFKVDDWLEAAQLASIAKRPEGEIRCWRWNDAKEAVRG